MDLVYVNFKEFTGCDITSKIVDIPSRFQEWRSVSFIAGIYAGVVFCNNSAPRFLRDLNKKGIILAENPLNIW